MKVDALCSARPYKWSLTILCESGSCSWYSLQTSPGRAQSLACLLLLRTRFPVCGDGLLYLRKAAGLSYIHTLVVHAKLRYVCNELLLPNRWDSMRACEIGQVSQIWRTVNYQWVLLFWSSQPSLRLAHRWQDHSLRITEVACRVLHSNNIKSWDGRRACKDIWPYLSLPIRRGRPDSLVSKIPAGFNKVQYY